MKDVLIFDTETTSLPPKGAKWDENYAEFPHIVQMAWIFCDVQFSSLIRPDDWEIPEESIAIHGITDEMAIAEGKPFPVIVGAFIAACHKAKFICAHNIHFDTSVIKANILREMGREWYDAHDVEGALHKSKRIDTMRSTIGFVGSRFADGRLKFPRLDELYDKLFPGQVFRAHDAMEDCRAVEACLFLLVEKGIVALELKQYPSEGEISQNNGTSPEVDKDTKRAEKAAQIEEFEKLTPNVSELLAETEF